MQAALMVTGSKSLRLTWTDQPGVSAYQVYRSTTSVQPGSPIATVAPGTQVFNDHGNGNPATGLTPNTAYWYWVADQNAALLAGPLTATTSPAAVKGPLYKDVQDALSAWVGGVTGFSSVVWADQNFDKPALPFALLDTFGPTSGGMTSSLEQANEALGQMQTWTVTVQVFTGVPDSSGSVQDAFQYALDLRASQDDPSVTAALSAAGVGIGERQAVQNLSATMETEFQRRAVFDFDINVRNVYPLTMDPAGGVIEAVTPIESTVNP